MSDVVSEGDGGWLDAMCDNLDRGARTYTCAICYWPQIWVPDHIREIRPEPREMGYMRAPERGFAEDIWRAIRLSHLRFISKLLDTGRYDRRFHTRLENL
jgi:hypothetical protein